MSKFTPQLNEVLKSLKLSARKLHKEWMEWPVIYKRKDGSVYTKIPKK